MLWPPKLGKAGIYWALGPMIPGPGPKFTNICCHDQTDPPRACQSRLHSSLRTRQDFMRAPALLKVTDFLIGKQSFPLRGWLLTVATALLRGLAEPKTDGPLGHCLWVCSLPSANYNGPGEKRSFDERMRGTSILDREAELLPYSAALFKRSKTAAAACTYEERE